MCFTNEALYQILCCTCTLHNIQHTHVHAYENKHARTHTHHTDTHTHKCTFRSATSVKATWSPKVSVISALSVAHGSAKAAHKVLVFLNNISKCCSCQRDADLFSTAWHYLKPSTIDPMPSFEVAEGKLQGVRERTLTRHKYENAASNLSCS